MPSADRFETKEYQKYKEALRHLGKDVLPRVIAETINVVAGFAHVQSVRNVRQKFTLRNRWTEGSIRFYKATPKANWMKIKAVTGSISDYMDEQDMGGYRLPKKGGDVMEATLAARGGNSRSVVKRRFVSVGKKMPKQGLGPKQFVGKPRGKLDRPYGLYQRTTNKKEGKKYLVMIKNISRARVPIEGKRWHRDAVEFKYRRELLTNEFIRQAKAELAKIGAK